MRIKGDVRAQSHNLDAERDRMFQVLALEYATLREEILTRLNARYQFVGFITTAAALIGVGIGYSSGWKIWPLVALAVAVLVVGVFGYFQMRMYGMVVSAKITEIEDRINKLVPPEPGTRNLLSWETEHRSGLLPRFFKADFHPPQQ